MSHKWACLLGQPVEHSLSPALHNAAFKALGIDAHYEAWLVAPSDLPRAVEQLRSSDCLGGNVTAPHKAGVVPLLDAVSEEVNALCVVNTIVNDGGRLTGGNTDAAGLARWMWLSDIDPGGRAALVLGAGGAARSAIWALAELGVERVTVLNRTLARAEDLVATFAKPLERVDLRWGSLDDAARPSQNPVAVVINATSLGHVGRAPDVHPSWYSPGSIALELAYNPPETRFMIEARAAGARAENGIGMLMHQAALAFERWTGQAAPMDIYESVVSKTVTA